MATGGFEGVLTPQGERTRAELRTEPRPHRAVLLLQTLTRRQIGRFNTNFTYLAGQNAND